MSRKVRKKKPVLNKANIFKIAIVVLIGIFVVITAKNIVSLKIEQSQLKAENQRLTQEKEDLKNQKDNINSKEYVEKQAREVLKMVKPGEKIFVLDDE